MDDLEKLMAQNALLRAENTALRNDLAREYATSLRIGPEHVVVMRGKDHDTKIGKLILEETKAKLLIYLPPGQEIDAYDPEQMATHGWVRKDAS